MTCRRWMGIVTLQKVDRASRRDLAMAIGQHGFVVIDPREIRSQIVGIGGLTHADLVRIDVSVGVFCSVNIGGVDGSDAIDAFEAAFPGFVTSEPIAFGNVVEENIKVRHAVA